LEGRGERYSTITKEQFNISKKFIANVSNDKL
jgi:hypothetical protein